MHAETVQEMWSDIRFILAEYDRLQQERDKLIEVLRLYADERLYQQSWYGRAGDYTQKARDILKEIGIKI